MNKFCIVTICFVRRFYLAGECLTSFCKGLLCFACLRYIPILCGWISFSKFQHHDFSNYQLWSILQKIRKNAPFSFSPPSTYTCFSLPGNNEKNDTCSLAVGGNVHQMKKIAATCKRGSSHLTTSKVSETSCGYTYLVHSSYLALGGLLSAIHDGPRKTLFASLRNCDS